jgi:hypothetical protein
LMLGNFNDMNQSLKLFLSHYNEDDWIFPGHGANSQLTEIKKSNPFLKDIINKTDNE